MRKDKYCLLYPVFMGLFPSKGILSGHASIAVFVAAFDLIYALTQHLMKGSLFNLYGSPSEINTTFLFLKISKTY